MAMAYVLDFAAAGMEQYTRVCANLGLEHLPPGALHHVAGERDDGLRVIDVWEDAAAFERFRDEQLGPQMPVVGISPPRVRAVRVAGASTWSSARPRLAQIVILPGLDAKGFAAMNAAVRPGGEPPDGLAWHVNGPVEHGWCVIDAWETAEQRERFMEERVGPVAARTDLTGLPFSEDLVVEATLFAAEPAGAR